MKFKQYCRQHNFDYKQINEDRKLGKKWELTNEEWERFMEATSIYDAFVRYNETMAKFFASGGKIIECTKEERLEQEKALKKVLEERNRNLARIKPYTNGVEIEIDNEYLEEFPKIEIDKIMSEYVPDTSGSSGSSFLKTYRKRLKENWPVSERIIVR